MKNKHFITILAVLLAAGIFTLKHEMDKMDQFVQAQMNELHSKVAQTQGQLASVLEADAKLQEQIARTVPLNILLNRGNVIQLTGQRVHMYHPTKKECGKNAWITSSGVRARPMVTAAIERGLMKKLGVEFGDILIVDGHMWIIESRMGKTKKKLAQFDLMYPIGAKQFRLLNATVHIIRVASAK